MDRSLIDQYVKGSDDLRMAVRGLEREDLLAYPVPGTWSIQEIVIHVADSDLVISDRMKRVIAEDNPQLIGFDETRFVKGLHYNEQSIEDAVNLFELNRRQMARVLAKLPDQAFDRVGMHNERGPMKLSDLLAGAVNHLKHHLKFIVEKREKLGKMMW
jgi:uncharacterized damage-inducible protein DinB